MTCTPGSPVETIDCSDSLDHVAIAKKTTVCNNDGNGTLPGDCAIQQCEDGYRLSENACAPRPCTPNQSQSPVSCTGEAPHSAYATKSKICNPAGDAYIYGNCVVTQCESGYTLSNNACLVQQCAPNQDLGTISCIQDIPHSTAATRTKKCNNNGTGFMYGACIAASCEPNYTLTSNACFSANQVMVVTASPATIQEGETSTLTWSTTSAVASVLIDGVAVNLNGSVSAAPLVSVQYVFKALDSNRAIISKIMLPVTVIPVSPPPLPPPPTGERRFTAGPIPIDGFKGSVMAQAAFRFRPNIRAGQRLSGIVTISVEHQIYAPTGVLYRLLIDGVPQPSTTIDTRQWSDGTHVVAFQVIDTLGKLVSNGSRVAVFNNSTAAFTSLQDQAIVPEIWIGGANSFNSLAWGRVNVLEPAAYPLDPELSRHPSAATDADRRRLVTERIWWVEGLNHQGTPLWQNTPILMKNKRGDYFVKQFNPESRGGLTPVQALPYVETAPAYDGPRGIGWLNPYSTLTPAPQILNSGQTGWVGVDLAGRVMRVDITGEVTTILGPRSVSGVLGTDDDELTVNLAARLANGEKEYVGDSGGLPLKQAQDIWTCNSFPFEGVIADTGNNRIVEIHFEKRKLMRTWRIPPLPVTGGPTSNPTKAPTSVWASLETQSAGTAWYAVNPDGLWRQQIIMDASNAPTAHSTVIEKVADIPNAFWVRGDRMRVYVLTLDNGIYEYVPATRTVIERRPRDTYSEGFVFMAVDENGSIGPRGRIYRGNTGTANSSVGKTTIYWHDPDNWSTGTIGKELIINRVVYGSWQALYDAFGHYMWGFAPHTSLPKFISAGITSSSWFIWTAALGDKPIADPAISNAGMTEWRYGQMDIYPSMSSFFGFYGHGAIGYSADIFRDYKTYGEARGAMRAFLDPLFPAGVPEVDRENMTKQLFAQRTRKHFQ